MRPLLSALVALLGASALAAQDSIPAGELTFRVVCSACHTLYPPVAKAPPMTHVAQHYRQAYTSEAEGVEAIVQWVLKPEGTRSKLPAHAIQRFGLMPAFPLPEPQLREVAKYVWSLGAGDAAAPTASTQPSRPPR